MNEEYKIGTRAVGVLLAGGFKDVEEVRYASDERLMGIRNCGKGTLGEIRKFAPLPESERKRLRQVEKAKKFLTTNGYNCVKVDASRA